MGVITCNEMWPGRDGKVDFTRKRTYTRVYEVYTDNVYNEAYVVSTAFDLPRIGTSYPLDLFARCVDVNPKQDEADPLRWIVTCSYDSRPIDLHNTQPDGSSTDPQNIPDNPLDRPPEFKFYFQQVNQVVRAAYWRDSNGNNLNQDGPISSNQGRSYPVWNSASIPFDPPAEYETSRMCMTITGNVANVDLKTLPKIQDSVNLKPWKGMQPRQVRCIGVEAVTAWDNNLSYWKLTYNFCIKWDLWDLQILDCGFGYIEKYQTINNVKSLRDTPIYMEFKDPFGHPPTSPTPMNGAGARLPYGANPVFLPFNVYYQTDFNLLCPW